MKLWLLRHAPVLLDTGLCYGASDVPADSALTLQAAQALAPLLPGGAPVWVSGLARARQLARALHRLRPDLGAPRTDVRLNEMDFGCWELQPWDAIPRAAFDEWMADFAHHRFGGAESTQEVIDRVAATLAELQHGAAAGQGSAPAEDAVWVTHAGVIRAAQFIAAGGGASISDVSQWPRASPEPGGWLALHF